MHEEKTRKLKPLAGIWTKDLPVAKQQNVERSYFMFMKSNFSSYFNVIIQITWYISFLLKNILSIY